MTGQVAAAVAVSLDGFIAGPGAMPADALGLEGDRLFTWFYDGDTPGRFYPWMKMSAASAAAFDGFIARIGAVISGRRTYDVTNGRDGEGEVPGAPLFVVTHHVPDQVPPADPPYTFVTDGIASAVRQALAAAAGRDVRLMGASIVQQCLRSGLLDELTIELARPRRSPARRPGARRRGHGSRPGRRRPGRYAPDLSDPQVGRGASNGVASRAVDDAVEAIVVCLAVEAA